jgi:hypothetical protein
MELKFIHITKCAGTSIEETGKKLNMEWGRYHNEYKLPNSNSKISPWHKCFSLLDSSLIDKYDWFVVVRNPYDRILSEYYCNHAGIGKNIVHSKVQINEYLINKILKRSLVGDHYTEQHKYLHPTKTIHILKFENLQNDFSKLMQKYNILDIQLVKANKRSDRFQGPVFEVTDFSDELIELINSVYSDDFSMFGYEKIIRGTGDVC